MTMHLIWFLSCSWLGLSTSVNECGPTANDCSSYTSAWVDDCPAGQRCITFVNQCTQPVSLAYQVGCNSNGTPGSPQCNCTVGPVLQAEGGRRSWVITDANYTSCPTTYTPACLTEGLAVLAGDIADCTKGTRFEFSAGNQADPFMRFDSYNIDIEKDFYSLPMHVAPNLTCAVDHANHDCRPLWCGSNSCPDAYATPTTGGCPDGRSPQAGCQDTFGNQEGYTVTYCPDSCTSTSCPSCQDAAACP